MTTYKTGREAELAAAEYLKSRGYKIVDKNWRTRFCEIDIIAEKNQTINFVEVKYRQSNAQGSGLEYITAQKLKQMQFAAEMWVADHDWGGDYCLAAMEVSGSNFRVTNLLTEL